MSLYFYRPKMNLVSSCFGVLLFFASATSIRAQESEDQSTTTIDATTAMSAVQAALEGATSVTLAPETQAALDQWFQENGGDGSGGGGGSTEDWKKDQACKPVIADCKSEGEQILEAVVKDVQSSQVAGLDPSTLGGGSCGGGGGGDDKKEEEKKDEGGGAGGGGGGGGGCFRLTLIGTHCPFYGGAPGTERILKLDAKAGDALINKAKCVADGIKAADAKNILAGQHAIQGLLSRAKTFFTDCEIGAGMLSDRMNGLKPSIQAVGQADIKDCKKNKGCKKKCTELMGKLTQATGKCDAGAKKAKSACQKYIDNVNGLLNTNFTVLKHATNKEDNEALATPSPTPIASRLDGTPTGSNARPMSFSPVSEDLSDGGGDSLSFDSSGGGDDSKMTANKAPKNEEMSLDSSEVNLSPQSKAAGGLDMSGGMEASGGGGALPNFSNGAPNYGSSPLISLGGHSTSDVGQVAGILSGVGAPTSLGNKGWKDLMSTPLHKVDALTVAREITVKGKDNRSELALRALTLMERVTVTIRGTDSKRFEVLAASEQRRTRAMASASKFDRAPASKPAAAPAVGGAEAPARK